MEKLGEAVLGAAVGELLKLVISVAKKVKAFRSDLNNLALTIERLIPRVDEIVLSLGRLDLGKDELKGLKDTIENANKLVLNCSQVGRLDILSKKRYSDEIRKIDMALLKYCQMDLQLFQSKHLLQVEKLINDLSEKVDSIRLGRKNFMEPCSVPEPERVTVGLDWPMTELKKMLLVDGTSAIVVSAPAGCGKTTLVTKLCHDAEIKGKFKSIFFVIVSRTPNVKLIAQKLLQCTDNDAPPFGNDSEAIVCLQKLLKQIGQRNPMLLVLDDVWSGAESMLPKFAVHSPNYKILVTSRSEFLGFAPTYRLQMLKDEDARSLLIEHAGHPEGSISSTEYEVLLQKILERCNGYPMAIKVIGSSLKNRSLTTWKSLVLKLSEGKKILNASGPDLLECLQTSVDVLDSDLKECFSDLGLFPEDQKIRASTLIDIWVELYYLDKEGIHALKFLEDLSSQNLLTLFTVGRDGHEDGFYNNCIVTQHDILRELAIQQSELEPLVERRILNVEIRDNEIPSWFSNLTEHINARLLSLNTDESFSVRWGDKNFPMVEALVLNFSTANYALPGFIAKMERLRVLTVANCGFFPAKVSNLSCVNSSSNLKRIRFEKVTSLDIGQLQLRSLQKMSFVMCNIGEVFYDSDMDISEALPSLQEIDIDYCKDMEELPYWICEVTSLKKLSITNCNKLSKLPEDIANLTDLQILRLSSCIDLSELPETFAGLQKLKYLDISDCMSLKKLPTQIGTLQSLKKISMSKCSRCELPMSIMNLKDLEEVKCDEETAVHWERLKPILKKLSINVPKTAHNLDWLKMF